MQNGLTGASPDRGGGRGSRVEPFVNIGADYLEPGKVIQGNIGTFRIGELGGGEPTDRVREFVSVLPYAEATDNVLGYLWGKSSRRHARGRGRVGSRNRRDLREPALSSAHGGSRRGGARPGPGQGREFRRLRARRSRGSLDRLAEFNHKSAKKYSGIYRDPAIRKRKTEIDEVLTDINGPIFAKVAELIHDIEEGRRVKRRESRRARRLCGGARLRSGLSLKIGC